MAIIFTERSEQIDRAGYEAWHGYQRTHNGDTPDHSESFRMGAEWADEQALRDIDRAISGVRKNMLDAFCKASCKDPNNIDGQGTQCARNTCAKWLEFTRLACTCAMPRFENAEAKRIFSRYNKQPEK